MFISGSWRTIFPLLACLILISLGIAQEPAGTAKLSEPAKNSGGLPDASVDPKTTTPFARGMQLYYERDLKQAAAKFKEAAELSGPESAASYAWLSRMQLMLREPDEAGVSADKAWQLDKDLPTAQSAVGELLYRQGRFTEAQEIFRRIALVDKPDARPH